MFSILVAEDDRELRRLFRTVLEKNGYRVVEAADGEAALEALEREYVDLIVCDVMMPRLDGHELTHSLREAGYSIPVLMITALSNFQDKQKGFQAGTDDYMVKPVDVNEMILRVGALLRRAQIATERKITVGETELSCDTLTATCGEARVVLPQKEFYLLYKLLSYPDRIFTRHQLMDEIWGMDSETEARTVDVHVNRLRDRFRDCTDFEIVTVRGLGYKAVRRA